MIRGATSASLPRDRAQAKSPSLATSGLVRRLGGRLVVDDVSITVQPGEVVGLLGANGAGKTTCFRLLVGALRPERGRVMLAGRDVTRLPLHARARLGLGYLPQEPTAFRGLSVQDNVRAVLEIRGQPLDDAEVLLATFGLSELARQRASTLSGGERRRLEVARLLATRPTVVLLDEPLAGLDADSIAELSRQIKLMTARGVAVLFTDHNLQQALALCDRAYVLADGRVVDQPPATSPGEQRVNQ